MVRPGQGCAMMWEPGYDPDRDQRVEDLTDRLFALMSALPRRNDDPKSDGDMHRWARNIAQLASWPMPFNNGMKQAKRAVVQRELNDFAKNIRRAEKDLLGFHNSSFEKALQSGTSVWEIRKSLEKALSFAASIENMSFDDLPEKTTRGREHWHADAVSMQCAINYYRITGREPGRTNKDGEAVLGLFERFLADVFDVMSINASADERARHAASEFKRRWGKRSASADR